MGNTESVPGEDVGKNDPPAGGFSPGVEESSEPPAVIPEAERLRLTRAELAAYNGKDGKPLYIGLAGLVYDVSSRPDFYGADGGGYYPLVGRDASRALATMQLHEEGHNVDDLDPQQQKTLQEWVDRYQKKYPIVGYIVEDSEMGSSESGGGPGRREEALAADDLEKTDGKVKDGEEKPDQAAEEGDEV